MTIQRIKKIIISTTFGQFLCHFIPNKPDRGYTIVSPQAPGFVGAGDTLAEAKRIAKSGLEFHCECIALERMEKERAQGTTRHLTRRPTVASVR